MKKNWMTELAQHYEKCRQRFPNERLLLLFDIDGTILDMRYMVLTVLQAYDRERGTRWFRKLTVEDIGIHENQVETLLQERGLPPEDQAAVLTWYEAKRWTPEYILCSHTPLSGVLEVIRWFQLQPSTFVGLNTGRPERLRRDTLRSLNQLGKEYKVEFSDALLYMNRGEWGQRIPASKVAGLRHFSEAGYRVFAFVDNEPENLAAVAKADPKHEILLLHANTIFESKRARLPSGSVKGKRYDLTDLIPERALPKHIQFVWHGINDEVNLRQFLASDIAWGECDVRLDPIGRDIILRHDSFQENPLDAAEDWLDFDQLLDKIMAAGKSIKVDLKAGGVLVDKVLACVAHRGFPDDRLWFNGNVERVQEAGFRKLASGHPDAILQCPVDFLAPLIGSAPEKAKDILDLFCSWGINRFSVSWTTEGMRALVDQLHRWGFEINIYNTPDLEAFLQAVLLLPRSITSDFNFPKWHYYGRGSGENSRHYEYAVRQAPRRVR